MKLLRPWNFIMVLIVGLPILSFSLWYFAEKKSVNALIIDKTVLNEACNEHKSFSWVLNYDRYVTSSNVSMKPTVNYMGFFPQEDHEFEIKDLKDWDDQKLDDLAKNLDLLYLTDTYGIYHNEWYEEGSELEFSPKVYGGMLEEEYQLMEKMVEQNKLLLTEFNILASPTPRAIRKKTEDLLEIKWTGWTGRYFDVLDTLINPELPKWVIHLYERNYMKNWNFHNSGLVLVHESEKIVILENEHDLDLEVPVIHANHDLQENYDVIDSVNYPFWFDITWPKDLHNIKAWYQLYPNESGDSLLKAHRLPLRFPAVIAHQSRPQYYFCGDFADNPIPYGTSFFKGSRFLTKLFYYEEDPNDRKQFFWKFYRPLLHTIMKEHIAAK